MKNKKEEKIIVVLGPTASGKSTLAVQLAKKLNGEIISADSRQVYRDMDIGTGKITKKEMQNIPHYLLDVADPKKIFTVAEYRKLALKALDKIFKKNKTPIVCGGTGFYIQALVDGIIIPEVAPDWKLRKKLEKKSTKYLHNILKKMDRKRAGSIDKNNPRRLIRAIEIVIKTKKAVPELKTNPLPYNILFLGIKKSDKELEKLIEKRLEKRLKQGLVAEIKKLRENGVSWKRLESFGLEYKYVALYLKRKINHQEMTKLLQKEIKQYAKRQMTWFNRDKRIKWVKNYKESEKLANFLENK
jgi:tRNA dimethylallyltransferase